ncbi:EKC/KEOPS complex subunit LAGE3 [Geodia barretti]|uniref:L antigen family member 3 n=1 Tax=Geodia barretti TaxID=519541 RepID=A0AA35R994_GEOBA|nr:EKC/KEOPS complex subunit LAGE3 [Geodia barretti]
MRFATMTEKHSCELRVPFEHEGEAEVAYNTLKVDPEPPRSGVTKSFLLEKNMLIVTFEAEEARKLRVAVGSSFDLISLVVDTIREFGTTPPT